MKKQKYNVEKANLLADNFKKLTNIDFKDTGKKTESMYLRMLFYKILTDMNNMNDRQIEDWFKEFHNVKRNRSSIYHALRKTEIYYNSFPKFRYYYDKYFSDAKELHKEQKRLELNRKMKALGEPKREESMLPIEKKRNSLKDVIESLPADRLMEIERLLTLRIKSWSWKSKDQCQIIDGYESLANF
jgi:hypothetical protein